MQARIQSIRFDRTGKNDGCTCDRCGQYIRNIWTVTFSNGSQITFGIDCFEKVYKHGNMSEYQTKQFVKLLKKIQKHRENFEKWKTRTEAEERAAAEKCGVPMEIENPESSFFGMTFEEFRQWMLYEYYAERFKEDERELAKFKKFGFEI